MKIKNVLAKLQQWHAPLDFPEKTNDTVKIGDVEQECTGIIVTCFASVNVIQQAIDQKCNLIICHEPLFYGDAESDGLDGDDPIFHAKQSLLEDHGIVVWRDHDYMHGPGGPGAQVHKEIDYIFYGIMKELGWEPYIQGERTKPLWYQIPPRTVAELTKELIDAFNLNGARVIGDWDAVVTTVFFCEHISGKPGDSKVLKKARDADVMIPLEIVDWTLSEYVRDAQQLGYNKAIIEMGHFNVEELGMRYMAKLLPEVLQEELRVAYVQSGDGFQYLVR